MESIRGIPLPEFERAFAELKPMDVSQPHSRLRSDGISFRCSSGGTADMSSEAAGAVRGRVRLFSTERVTRPIRNGWRPSCADSRLRWKCGSKER